MRLFFDVDRKPEGAFIARELCAFAYAYAGHPKYFAALSHYGQPVSEYRGIFSVGKIVAQRLAFAVKPQRLYEVAIPSQAQARVFEGIAFQYLHKTVLLYRYGRTAFAFMLSAGILSPHVGQIIIST